MENSPGGNSARRRTILFAAIVVIMLLAGLSPRGLPFRNRVDRHPDQPGLMFDGKGIAYTPPFISGDEATAIASVGLTTEIALQLPADTPPGFAAVAVFHNGDDDTQWILGQWQHHLILMNGDDYSHKRRLPRISVDLSAYTDEPVLLTITSNREGSVIHLNGEEVIRRSDFTQSVPAGGRLVLGNSIYGKNPWSGSIDGLAFFHGALDPATIKSHYTEWARSGSFADIDPTSAWLLYPLDEETGRRSMNRSGIGPDIEFPGETLFLNRVFLARDTRTPFLHQLLTRDAALNLFGFIPFGWVLTGLLFPFARNRSLPAIVLATTAGFLLSIGFEFLQTWMPTRSSSLLDLQLNTLGSFAGAALFSLFAQSKAR